MRKVKRKEREKCSLQSVKYEGAEGLTEASDLLHRGEGSSAPPINATQSFALAERVHWTHVCEHVYIFWRNMNTPLFTGYFTRRCFWTSANNTCRVLNSVRVCWMCRHFQAKHQLKRTVSRSLLPKTSQFGSHMVPVCCSNMVHSDEEGSTSSSEHSHPLDND